MPCNTEVPSALRALDQWILWRLEGDRKIPYQVNGRKAKSNDPSTWSSYAVAHAAGEQLGFCFAENGGLFGLDLDGCRDPATGEIAEWAKAVINELASYSEVSPSGTGVKVYGLGSVPGSTGKKVAVDEPPVCDKAPGIEVYDHGRYFAFTGQRLPSSPVELNDCQAALGRVCDHFWPAKATPEPVRAPVPAPMPRGGNDVVERARRYLARIDPPDPRPEHPMDASTQLYRGACVMVGFGIDDGTAAGLLMQWDACNPCGPYPEREIQRKLNEARKTVTWGQLLAGRGYEGPDVDLRGIMDGALAAVLAEPPPPDEVGDEVEAGAPEAIDRHLFYPEGLIGEIVRYNMETAQYPQLELAFAAAIALMATIAGRKVQDTRGTRTNMYLVGLAPSGAGKEHARKVNKRLMQLSGAPSAMLSPERIGSPQGVITWVHDSPSILFQLDEVAKLLESMRSNDSHLYLVGQLLLTLYSSSDVLWKSDALADPKKTKEIMCPNACLYGCNTPDGFWQSLTSDNVSEGLVGRMMVFESGYVAPQDWKPRNPPEDLVKAVKHWVNWNQGDGNIASVTATMAAVEPACVTIPYEPAALDRLNAHTRAIASRREDESPLNAAIWSRTAEKSAKLALLFACSRMYTLGRLPTAIGLDDVERAIAISNFASRSLVHRVQEYVASNQQESKYKKLLRLITSKGVTKTQLGRQSSWLAKKEREQLLDQMIDDGRVIVDTTDSDGGRPRTYFKRAAVKSLH